MNDGWIVKTDSRGDTLWTKLLGDLSDDLINSGLQTADGGYILTGLFTDSEGINLWLVKLSSQTAIIDNSFPLPTDYRLEQNYPNPFNPTTTISYFVPAGQRETVKIYNINGKLIKTLINGRISTGYNSINWDGTDNRGKNSGSGVYFYELKSKGVSLIKKMFLIK